MKPRLLFPVALVFFAALPVLSQRPAERGSNPPRANQGRVPQAPVARPQPRSKPEEEHHPTGHVNTTPHVNNDHWYGHASPNDKRFHVDHPFEHGRFEHVGASFRYNVLRIDRDQHRFWFPGGFYFDIAAWDWPLCADWCWDCGDDFTVYEDPDHPGWYMLYNVHTGGYVHVTYMGS